MFKASKWDVFFKGLIYIILGVIVFLMPEKIESFLGYVLGGALILTGAIFIISYLLRDPILNYDHNGFASGIAIIAIGAIVLFKMDLVVSLLPLGLGLLVLISGVVQLQDCIDMNRLKYKSWGLMLVFSAVNIILGVVLIANPFKAALTMFKVLGAGLVLSGLTDIYSMFYLAGKYAKYQKAMMKVKDEMTEGDTAENTEKESENEDQDD
ncbi:MAG: DUF308 domain-containing protein [Acetatifactor sp.]|nr:DUF308 domain-containing protein [Acetatifactor sp.]